MDSHNIHIILINWGWLYQYYAGGTVPELCEVMPGEFHPH